MLNQYFNITRLAKYVRYELSLNSKTYILFLATLFLGLFFIDFVFLNNVRKNFNHNEYMTMFLLSSVPIILLVVGTGFNAFRKQINRFHYLTIPSSIFEKFLFQFIIRVILFPAIFLVLFWLEFKLAKYVHLQFEENQLKNIMDFSIFEFLFDINGKRDRVALMLSAFSIATFFFAGSAWFNKYAFFKTLFSFVVLIGVSLLFMVLLSHLFFPEQVEGLKISMNRYKISPNFFNVQFFIYLISCFMSLLLIPLAYFKVKEKEV